MKKSFFLVVLMLLTLVSYAETVEIDGIYYNIIIKGRVAEVTSNPNKYTDAVDIPEEITYEGVPCRVTSIGDNAFAGCKKLTAIIIPNTVTSIGETAFINCSKMASISIPNSVTSIGSGAFNSCSKITSIVIPNSVESIGHGAFYNCTGLTSVSIPNSMSTIDDYTFQSCNSLTSISIPNSITILGKEISFTHDTGVFQDCNSLTSINIPGSVASIGFNTFSGCTSLTSVYVNCQIIDNWFSGLPIKNVEIGENTTTIKKSAFSECRSLISVSIGKNVNNIGSQAFAKCDRLENVYCYAKNVPSTEENAFQDSYPEYMTLFVPASSMSVYENTKPWSDFSEIKAIDYDITTTIGTLKTKHSETEEIFSLDGHQQTRPQKGIYIIKFANGTTKKLLINR